MIRLLVELRVQRDDAAVGVFQFPVQPREFLLFSLQFVERAKEFLVLQLYLFDQPFRTPVSHGLDDLFNALGVTSGTRGGNTFSSTTRVPVLSDLISKRSISRRAPTIPIPIPVDD
jgi:hypothetical protein